MPIPNLGTRNKAAADSRTYSIDWTAWLAGLAGSDTITSCVYTVPTGLTLVTSSNTTTKTNVKVSGGTSPTTYTVTETVTTVAGEVKEVAFNLYV